MHTNRAEPQQMEAVGGGGFCKLVAIVNTGAAKHMSIHRVNVSMKMYKY